MRSCSSFQSNGYAWHLASVNARLKVEHLPVASRLATSNWTSSFSLDKATKSIKLLANSVELRMSFTSGCKFATDFLYRYALSLHPILFARSELVSPVLFHRLSPTAALLPSWDNRSSLLMMCSDTSMTLRPDLAKFSEHSISWSINSSLSRIDAGMVWRPKDLNAWRRWCPESRW